MKYLISICCLLAVIVEPAAAQTHELTGNWKGYISIHGHKLRNLIHIKKQKNNYRGTIDIPQQGAKDLRLHKIIVTSQDSVSWKFDGGPGGMIRFKGQFKNDSTIVGIFHQSGYEFPFKLHRYIPEPVKQKSLSYHHRDLIIRHDSIKIGGTLTCPKNKNAHQLVIMISGSGAQNRDENIFGFKIFGQIAYYLTLNGIATFRFDDRGMGESTGNFTQAGLDELTSDIKAIVTHFSQTPNHNFSNIVLLGHSQGGYIGTHIAAQDSRIDKLILMSSPAVPLRNVVLAQTSPQYVKQEKAIFDILQGSQNFKEIIDSLVKKDLEDFNQAPDSIKKQIKNPPQYFWNKEHRELEFMASPSYFSFLNYHPTKDLSRLSIPVLALFGGKDTQVLISQNRPPMQLALDSAEVSYQVNVFKDANHLFQKAKTGQVQEYGSLPGKFVDGFLSTIEQWIKQTSEK